MAEFKERFKKSFNEKKRRFGRKVSKQRKRIIVQIKKLKEFKFRYLNLSLLLTALIFLIAFMLFELFLRSYNLYQAAFWVDVPSHFFAGIAIAALALWLLHFANGKYQYSYAMISVFIAAAFWEIIEIIEDFVIPNPPYLQDLFFWDGFWDIIVTLIGGIFFIWIFKKYLKMKLKKRVSDYFSTIFKRSEEIY